MRNQRWWLKNDYGSKNDNNSFYALSMLDINSFYALWQQNYALWQQKGKNEKSKNVTIKTITLAMLYGNRKDIMGVK